MLGRLLEWLHPPAIREAADLRSFVTVTSAHITHKATVAYCRVKAGAHVRELFKEPPFRQALDACRRQCLAWIAGDVVLVAQGFLRGVDAGIEERVDDALAVAYRRLLVDDPLRQPGAADEEPYVVELRQRLARARLAAPIPAAEVGRVSAPKVFHSLPIHPRLRGEDEEAVTNLIRFGLASFAQDMERRLDAAAVVADMLDDRRP